MNDDEPSEFDPVAALGLPPLTDPGEPDGVVDPHGPMADVDIALLLDVGAPPEAIRRDRTVDFDLLLAQGWTLENGSLAPPDTPEFHKRTQRAAERRAAKRRSQ